MNQTIFITGANGGIGQALCELFKANNYFVIASDRTEFETINCDAFVEADLIKICKDETYRLKIIQDIRNHLDGCGLNGLINNAAVQILKHADKLTMEDWHTTLDVNLLAPFALTQSLLTDLELASGSVVNVASIHAYLTKPNFSCYATSKTALVGLTRSMAIDLGGRVRVNAICPAAVRTPMLLAGFDGNKKHIKNLEEHHPIKRIAQPSEVAAAAKFLISNESLFMTGETLNICGGIRGRLHDPF